MLAVVFSGYIGYNDLYQTDKPLTAAALLAASFLVGLFVSRKVWLYGIIVGVGVPLAVFIALYNHWTLTGVEQGRVITWTVSYTDLLISLGAVFIAILGAYSARVFRRLFLPQKVN